MPTHIPLVSGESRGFRFLGLFPLLSNLLFPVIMTCVLDLQVCLDNQRLIGGTATIIITCSLFTQPFLP